MSQRRIIRGLSVAPGLSIGAVHVCRAAPNRIPTWSIPGELVDAEISRLEEALSAAGEDLQERQEIVAREVGEQDARIFATHRLILEDPSATAKVQTTIREERINAEAAVDALIKSIELRLGQSDLSGGRGMAAEASDPWRDVLEILMRRDRESVVSSGGQVVLAAEELTPGVVTFLDRSRVLAVVAEKGGRFSHGAVLARSFGIPCVVGLPNLLTRLEQDMQVAVDGDEGTVQLRPEESAVADFLERMQQRATRRLELAQHGTMPAVTPCGERHLSVQVNVESLRDLDTFPVEGIDGVGLLRTEFLYMERSSFPSEEEQYRLYRRVIEHMEGKPVTLRLLDIGGDKHLPYFKLPDEPNPALGWRGIRLTLEWTDLLIVQLRAVLRASAHGDVRVLLPMVTSLEEILQIHRLFDDERRKLESHGYEVAEDVPVGAMIEVPSALLVLPSLLKEVDFVSVGTNDLVQYLLAADRDNSRVASLYDPHHPSVMWALRHVAESARAAGVSASLCGEFAGDRVASLVLLGMGFDSISVAPHFVPELKYAIRRTQLTIAEDLARLASEQHTTASVREVFASARAELESRQADASTRA